MEILKQIETIGHITSQTESKITVAVIGYKNASHIKTIMLKNGYNYISGEFVNGVYELGFRSGEN